MVSRSDGTTASITHSSNGFPLKLASCLGLPKRRDSPAAKMIPAVLGLFMDYQLAQAEVIFQLSGKSGMEHGAWGKGHGAGRLGIVQSARHIVKNEFVGAGSGRDSFVM